MPVTLTNCYCTEAQFKAWMNIPTSGDTTDDAAIQVAVNAASRAVDSYCNRRFWADSQGGDSPISPTARYFQADNPFRLHVDDFYAVGTDQGQYPLLSTDEGNNGDWAQVWTENTDYVRKASGGYSDNETGFPYTILDAVGGRRFPTYGRRERVRVYAYWGWSAVPDEVTNATLIKAARLFRRKDTPEGIAGGGDMGAIRISRWEDPDVVNLLNPYVRQNALVW